MPKIISLIIIILNRINKFIEKFINFLVIFIKIDEINHLDHLDDKPEDVKYRLFNVDESTIMEAFVKIEHKDHKQLIKDNNIKPIKRRNVKSITIDVKCHCCVSSKDYFYDNTGKQKQFDIKFVLYFF